MGRARYLLVAAAAFTPVLRAARAQAPASVRSSREPVAFVTNEASLDISVVDLARRRVVATIPVGARPRGIQVSPDGRHVFVAVSDEAANAESDRDAIVVLDATTRREIGRFKAGTDPEQLAVAPDGLRIFAANEDAGTATVIDLRTTRVLSTAVVGIETEG